MGPALGRGLGAPGAEEREASGWSWLGPSTPSPTPGRCPGKEGRGQGAVGSALGAGPTPARLPRRGWEQEWSAPLPGTHLEAVKICLLLVQMALMGLSWPLISPMGVKLSTFQTLTTPARQALSSMGRPGTKARAHTQSLCAVGIC